MSNEPRTVVLVHGAWHGAWCWAHVQAGLEARSIPSIAVHLPFTGLADDAATVAALLDDQPAPVVLVGHSYGGMVISEAAAGRDDGVDHLVYLCALMLRAGQSPMEGAADRPVALAGALQVDESGRSTVADAALVPAFYADVDPDVAADAVAKLRDFPVAALASVQHEPWRTIESTYVRCLQDQAIHPDHQAEMAELATHLVEWDCAHSPFLSDVDLMVDLLERLATG